MAKFRSLENYTQCIGKVWLVFSMYSTAIKLGHYVVTMGITLSVPTQYHL